MVAWLTIPGPLARLGRALAYRNFRLFFFGQAVSLIGTWMQRVGMLWLVYRLTESSALLGIVGFCEQIPTLLTAPFAGVLTDRWPRHRVLVVTQLLLLAQAIVLSTLVLTGTVRYWHLLVLGSLLGTVSGFDITARQGFFAEMVPRKEDLANAIALNSSVVNGARLIGPALAGLLIAWTGEGFCFLLNGVSYLAVLISLLRMTLSPEGPRPAAGRFWHNLREGVVFAAQTRPVRNLLLLMAAVSFLGMPYTVLMPVIAREVFHGDADLLGWLMTASGVGALAASVVLAGRPTVLGLSKRVALAPIVFGAALIAFALVRHIGLALVVLPPLGYAMMTQMASSNTILQTIAPEDKRGRVMSFAIMSFMGTVPLGSLVLGALAEHVGPQYTLLLGGVGCLIAGGLFAVQLPLFRRDLRAIYERLGILRPRTPATDDITPADDRLAAAAEMALASNQTTVMPGAGGPTGVGLTPLPETPEEPAGPSAEKPA